MKKTKSKEDVARLLTDTELELMTILWKLSEGTVADVIRQLPEERKLAYTSVSTILRILEQKQVLKSRKEGRGHVYVPKVKKSDYESRTVKHMVNRVFDGTPLSLVKQLLETVQLNSQELMELKNLIAQHGEKK